MPQSEQEFETALAAHAGHDLGPVQDVGRGKLAICATCRTPIALLSPPKVEARPGSAFTNDGGPMGAPRCSGVYYAYACGTGRVKIGLSENVRQRLSGLDTSSATGIHLAAFEECAREALVERERLLHGEFAALRVRQNAEFFRLEGLLVDRVNEIRASLGYAPFDRALFDEPKDRESEAVEVDGAWEAIIGRQLPALAEEMRKLLRTRSFKNDFRRVMRDRLVAGLKRGSAHPFTVDEWCRLMGSERYFVATTPFARRRAS